jgi:hypothetical protein
MLTLFKRMLPKNLAALKAWSQLLLEYRRAGLAQARLLPAQASGDGARIGNFAGAKPVDVGRAGTALLGRALLGEGRTGRKQSEEKTQRRGPRGPVP